MENIGPLWIFAGLGAALVVVLLFVVFRLLSETRTLRRAQTELTGRLSHMAEETRSGQAQITKALNDRLDTVSQRMGQSLEQSADKTTKTMTDLTKRLAIIDEAQKHIKELSGQMVGLQDILSDKQARGAFGEIQLNDLVKGVLPPSAYEFQKSLSNGKRADCVINLPNPPGPIVIDAKFPLESYRALVEAREAQAQSQAARRFTADVLKHVNDIADRYIVPGETAESALMFLPSESVYAELHANFTDVLEKSFRRKVWIVSPTTMMATLNTVRAILKDVRMREQAHVIQAEVHKMFEDVARLDERVRKLDTHFKQANRDIDQILTSSGKIQKRATKIEELEIDEPDAIARENIVPITKRRESGE